MNERTLFLAALDLDDPVERASFLDAACAGDLALRKRVGALLSSHACAGNFLGRLAPQRVAEELARHQGDEETQEDGPEGDKARIELGFLAPSVRPGSLGRLAHFEVLEVVGRGGMGIVLRAFDDRLHRVVAIKVLAPELATTSSPRKRFLREARAAAAVRHEHVVDIHAVEELPLPFLVMEYVAGETLQQRLDRAGPLEVPDVARIGQQVARGLAAAHERGLVHRDVKPSNILIERSAGEWARITDFGLARAADDASLSQSGVIAGTPMYMSPEQAQGEALDHRADLFSLGSVLYTMCSGRPPFRANNTLAVLKRVAEDTPRPIREIIPEVPQWLCDLIARLHAKNAKDRIGTAREVADLLGRGLAQMQCPGPVPTPVVNPGLPVVPAAAPAQRPSWPRAGRWAVAAAALLLPLGGLGFTEATGVTAFGGTVVRLFSPEGTLVVEVDDPGVRVEIDGPDLVIRGAGAREVRLKTGDYTVEARKDGKVVSRELVRVTRNGRQVVRVRQEARRPAGDADRRAAEHVLSIGGGARVDGQDLEIRAVANLPPGAFRLTGVNFYYFGKVLDADLARLADCSNHLTVLALVGTKVTDAGLAHLKGCKNLLHLDLRETQVTDAGLASFKDCKTLKLLGLRGNTKATDAGLASFQACKDLGILDLGDYRQLTDEGLGHFKDSKKLHLVFLGNTRISDACLGHLKEHKELGHVFLHGTRVTAAGIGELKKALPKCKVEWDGDVNRPR